MATWYDRVLVTTTTTGTGTLTLGSAVTGYATLAGVADGTTVKYSLEAVDAAGTPTGVWEVGTGTVGGSGTTLARTTVEANSSGTQVALSLAAGTKRVMVTPTAEMLSALPSGRPAAFSFTDNTSATSNTLTTSDTVTLSGPSGVSDVWPVTVDGAAGSPEVRVNGGDWTAARVPAAVARSGDTLAVRITSGASLATRTATVRVGGRSTVWTVTSAAFSPTDLSSLRLWLTAGPTWCFADAAKTVPCGNGDPVYVWADRSGNAYDLTQSVSGSRPVLRQTGAFWYVDFDGVDDYLTGASSVSDAGTDPFCLACSARCDATSIAAMIGYGVDADGQLRNLLVNTNWYLNRFGDDWNTGAAADTSDHTHIFRCTAGTAAKWQVDTTEYTQTLTTLNAVSGSAFRVGVRAGSGSYFPLNGLIYGVVWSAGTVSDSERDALRTYLRGLYL